MNILTWIAAFITGLLASLGVGGGMVLIIWMTAVLGVGQLESQGTNLIFFLPIALLSVIIHRKNGLIDLKRILPAIITGIAAAAPGAYAAHAIGSPMLKKIFGAFILVIGVKELFTAGKKDKNMS